MKTHRSLLFTIIMLLLNINTSLGFECYPRRSVAEELEKTIAVFSGKAIAEEYRKAKTIFAGEVIEAEVLVVKFKVEKWWKGNVAEEVDMFTSVTKMPDGTTAENAEDFKFRKGESYLVYAYCLIGQLRTNGCTRTRRLAEAEEDLRNLGKGSEPIKKNDPVGAAKPNKSLKPTRNEHAC